MSESHLDEYEHMNYSNDQDKSMFSGHSGKQRSKKEAELNTNRHNPGGHERKIVTKLQNAEANKNKAATTGMGSGTSKSSSAKE
jgi:nuclear protein 1